MWSVSGRQAGIALASLAGAVSVATWLWRSSRRSKISIPQVVELWVHPIKGVKGFSVPEWPLTPTGLKFDREWAIVECDTGNAVSSNKHQRLATATALIDDIKGELRVVAPTMNSPLIVPLQSTASATDSSSRSITIFGMSGTAVDEGDDAARWFSKLLHHDVRLCRMQNLRRPRDSPKHVGTNEPNDCINFHDYATLHLICCDGVKWLQQKLPSNVRSQLHLTTQQFRANVVVDGVAFPDEDKWLKVTIGAFPMRVAKQSGRCVIPTHDAEGRRGVNFEPTATLRRLRAAVHRHQLHWEKNEPNFMFGIDLFHDACGTLRVGDRLVVNETRAPPEYLPPDWQDHK